jgi:hypothetical protein
MICYGKRNVNKESHNRPIPEESRKRMKVEIKGNELIITVEMQAPTPSASGKTLVIASSHGNQTTTAVVDGKPVIIGLNAYIKK